MSDSQRSDNSTGSHTYLGSGSPVADTLGELPAFQPFPAATRDARPRPSSRTQADSIILPASEVAPTGALQPGALEDRAATSAVFTPFPRAAPGSRWAPPGGVRPEPVHPIPPPAFVAEPAQYVSAYRGDVVRYPSNLPPGQPSPYAPPGPLTARPHICEHCETGFARAHDLRRHLETHGNDRPHKCPDCQRPFSRKDAVRRHQQSGQCDGPAAGSSSNS